MSENVGLGPDQRSLGSQRRGQPLPVGSKKGVPVRDHASCEATGGCPQNENVKLVPSSVLDTALFAMSRSQAALSIDIFR
jgi:hypothetical protein